MGVQREINLFFLKGFVTIYIKFYFKGKILMNLKRYFIFECIFRKMKLFLCVCVYVVCVCVCENRKYYWIKNQGKLFFFYGL